MDLHSGHIGDAGSLLTLVFGDTGVVSRLRLRQLRERILLKRILLKCIGALALRVELLEQFTYAAHRTGLDSVSELPHVSAAAQWVESIKGGAGRQGDPPVRWR